MQMTYFEFLGYFWSAIAQVLLRRPGNPAAKAAVTSTGVNGTLWSRREMRRTKWSLYKWKQMPGIMKCRSADGGRRWWSTSRPHSWSLTSDARVCSSVTRVPQYQHNHAWVNGLNLLPDTWLGARCPLSCATWYFFCLFDWSGCCSVCDWWQLWHSTSPPALLRKRAKKGLSVSLIFL